MVVEYKIVTYEYFLDKMQQYEIQPLIDMLPWTNKQSLEQTRILLWGSLSPYLKHKKTAEQMMPLRTDNNIEIEEHESISLDENQVEEIRNLIEKNWTKK